MHCDNVHIKLKDIEVSQVIVRHSSSVLFCVDAKLWY